MRILFLGGIHGAGKDYFAHNLACLTNYTALGASAIINCTLDSNKSTQHIDKNQQKLLYNLPFFTQTNHTYILTGHYCLLDKNGAINLIDPAIFHQLSPSALFLKQSPASVITQRLKTRDNKSYTPDFIAHFQSQERLHATHIAQKLHLPLRIISDNQEAILHQHLKKMWINEKSA